MIAIEESINDAKQIAVIRLWTDGYPEPFTTRVEPVDPETDRLGNEHAGEWRVSDNSDADDTYYPSFEAALDVARESIRPSVRAQQEGDIFISKRSKRR